MVRVRPGQVFNDLSTVRSTLDRFIRSWADVRDEVPTGAIKVWYLHQPQCDFSPLIFTWAMPHRYTPWIDANRSRRNVSQQPMLTLLRVKSGQPNGPTLRADRGALS